MKYWKIENINANTFVGNEIKRFEVKGYGSVIVTNDKWATANWDNEDHEIDIQPAREILP
jgi:hypothetical protein